MGYYNKELDEIDFQLFDTCEVLKPYIYSYWVVKKNKINESITQKVLSDGSMGIVINFKNPYIIKVNNTVYNCDSKFIIDGPTKYPSYLTFEKEFDMIGIRFNPAGAYIFFDEKIESFLDKHEVMKDSTSWQIDELYKNLQAKKNIEEKIVLIEDFFIKKLDLAKKKNSPWIFNLIDKIIQKKGDIEILDLCKEFNISLKQLERKFKEEVGLSPKVYIRIIRLRNVKNILSSLEVDNLTKTAYENGFFDQAHFTREFKFFMNETPKNYFKNKLFQAKLYNYRKY